MTFHLTRRTAVKIISFAIAILLVLAMLAFSYSRQAVNSRRTLEYHYINSISSLSNHMQNINSDLSKLLLSGTPNMMTKVSNKLWREAGLAKVALSGLPVEYLSLQNTNKFLSQVGDYCVNIANESNKGQKITEETRNNIKSLQDFSDKMLADVIAVNDAAQTGSLSLSKVTNNINREFDKTAQPAEVAEGFLEFEEGFTAYPSLIYDGPFSDHIMEREPLKLKDEQSISRADAKERIGGILGVPPSDFSDGNDEDSTMPSYTLELGETNISVTKKGGYLSYMLKSRNVQNRSLNDAAAIRKAYDFMGLLKIAPMQSTYYEISNNVMTINFACIEQDVLAYTDLIKVAVALDDGEILSFDARGFLVNNHIREDVTPTLSMREAQSSISPNLTVTDSMLCVIPSSGLNEVLCYEYKCIAPENQTVLVYVNAHTGAEEQILTLIIDENGQLTI